MASTRHVHNRVPARHAILAGTFAVDTGPVVCEEHQDLEVTSTATRENLVAVASNMAVLLGVTS